MTRMTALLLSMWLAVVFLALWVGGTLYQMMVIVPLWTAAPPESLRLFMTTGYPQTVLRFFGPPFIAARTAPLVAALVLGWPLVAHRRILSVAVGCWLFVVAFTLLYIYPMNDTLFVVGPAQPVGTDLRELLQRWILADQFRFAVGCVGFIALLWAFRLPLPGHQQLREV